MSCSVPGPACVCCRPHATDASNLPDGEEVAGQLPSSMPSAKTRLAKELIVEITKEKKEKVLVFSQ